MEKLKRFIKIVSPVLVVGALLALAVVTAFAAENPLAATGVFLAATGSKSIIAASVESTWIAVSGIVLIVSFCGLVASFAQKKKQFYNENGAEEVEKNDSIPYKNSDSKASADRAVVSDENNYVVYDADKAREADFVSASYEKYDAESEDEKFSVVTIEVDEGGEDRVDKVTEVFGVSKPSFKHILDNDKVKATPSKEDIEAAQREVAAAIEAEEAKARAEREKAEKEAAEIEAKRQAEEREKAEKEAAEKEAEKLAAEQAAIIAAEEAKKAEEEALRAKEEADEAKAEAEAAKADAERARTEKLEAERLAAEEEEELSASVIAEEKAESEEVEASAEEAPEAEAAPCTCACTDNKEEADACAESSAAETESVEGVEKIESAEATVEEESIAEAAEAEGGKTASPEAVAADEEINAAGGNGNEDPTPSEIEADEAVADSDIKDIEEPAAKADTDEDLNAESEVSKAAEEAESPKADIQDIVITDTPVEGTGLKLGGAGMMESAKLQEVRTGSKRERGGKPKGQNAANSDKTGVSNPYAKKEYNPYVKKEIVYNKDTSEIKIVPVGDYRPAEFRSKQKSD